MVAHHRVITRIVEAQARVMSAYLGSAPSGPNATAPAPDSEAPPINADTLAIDKDATKPPGPAGVEPVPTQDATLSGHEPAEPREDALSRLIALLAERTGYPPDLLDPDSGLESDLGIDSIKKVEVIGALRKAWPPFAAAAAAEPDAFEELTACKTLRSLADCATALIARLAGTAAADTSDPLPRFLPGMAESPGGADPALPADAVVLITDDEAGTGEALAAAVRSAGGVPVLIKHRTGAPAGAGDTADLGEERAVAELVSRIRNELGPISGVVHALPLRVIAERATLEPEGVRATQERDVRSLFLIAREVSDDLNDPERPGRFLIAATALGAGHDRAGAPVAHGGSQGLGRTLAREWRRVRVAIAGADPAAAPAVRAKQLLGELTTDAVDVTFAGGRRHVPAIVAAAADAHSTPRTPPPDPVVLITGGCGAVGSAISVELARRYGARIVLVGRTALPAEPEPEVTAGLHGAALRTAVADSLRLQRADLALDDVEQASSAIMRARAVRAALEAITAAGGTASYVQADVRDAGAFGSAIESVYHDHGRIDIAVHAAGVLADGRLETRTLTDLETVLATKVDGALLLARHLRPDSLHSLVLFGSVAGRFGNEGQSVYAAANATLDAIAAELDRRWPARVVAIDWGPWLGGGMVSPEVERRFRSLGIEPIDPAAGARAFVRELELGRKGEPEVVIGRGPWQDAHDHLLRPTSDAGPAPAGALLTGPGRVAGDSTVFNRHLDPDAEPFLDHHRLDSRAVLPAAFALEMMAEAYAATGPGSDTFEVSDFRVLRGVVLDAPAEVLVTVRRDVADGATVSIAEAGSGRMSYRATFRPAEPDGASAPPKPLAGEELDPAELYRSWLFHGPALQGIVAINAAGPAGIDAVLAAPDVPAIASPSSVAEFVVDPRLLDSAFQLSIVWARMQADATTLPAGFHRMRRLAPLGPGPLRCTLRGHPGESEDGMNLEVALELRSLDGIPLLLLEGAEFTAARSLNRLATTAGAGSSR
jgi:NADP-dependent 3-hydroxy acid dehydrogenase YdfG